MFRKFFIFPILLAYLMSMLPSLVPHHHHQAMICTAAEACSREGCPEDAHTHHAHSPEDETFCIAHEEYRPSETVRIDGDDLLFSNAYSWPAIPTGDRLIPQATRGSTLGVALDTRAILLPSPPLLSEGAPNAPPAFFS